ncbi:hypothetical protein HDF24_06305 [Mucilaginibacter sp. X4EP1]|uniref:hypothetical protein n=1 Tax=Mucilaginibacter sp. X4EP1 TaxID=2723092 RepID=UPI0021671599|nr:hypothetical protein [Mucilaginibacter sp. X4EP1]MCS3814288.1 hypothetical protein [Mucilaginibacter sp. X4EP1]
MNWKIIVQLSLFGLIMALGTIALIPQNVEPIFWLVIFVFCAFVIAKACPGKYFLHGFLVSMVNCVWITAAHIFFYNSYVSHHPEIANMSPNIPSSLAVHPRLFILIVGPFFGALSGLVLGLFSFIASKIVKKSPTGD